MTKLIFDPDLSWDGPFPYTALARFGVTPESSAAQVLDASYAIVAGAAADRDVNEAWESLRVTHRRLLVDFFCYAVDAPAAAEPGPPPTDVPWGLIEALERIDHDITLPLPPVHEPRLPSQLSDEAPLWEPGIHRREEAP